MLRIRGTVGSLPVDLTLELDQADWAQLSAHLGAQVQAPVAAASPTTVPTPSGQTDALWESAQQILRGSGAISGPELLEQLEGLAGNTAAGKRLLVRLRHSAQVKVESGADAPVYRWID
ncbi:hypothetical protein [Pseudomonas sp. R5(2019)]|uniref:hypothetical protein n=1 Tax=Pseudomonas sp. R5(2019) TaxID=2697566 RepID=UPI0014131736|nr:hypothetical protein [Pseudomonas sp. R5(2019)]NBA96109.1 hypothetical protein [Pseudomonas sp. R5(2019)]